MTVIKIESSGELEMAPGLLELECFKVLTEIYIKEELDRILKFIFFIADSSSPYNDIPVSLRLGVIKKDFIRNESFIISPQIQLCLEKYEELQLTPLTRLKRGINKKLDEMYMLLESEILSIDNIAMFNDTLKTTTSALKTFSLLDASITKEDVKTRGDVDINTLER